MSDSNNYQNLSIDEKLVLIDGKLNYLEKLILHLDTQITKLDEKIEKNNLKTSTYNNTEKAIEEPVAMGGRFGFGGTEAPDEAYTPVE
ncbi:MAG: hypothetical protein UE295_06615, partial [Acutalibacteraceae bacterium]|nr:hypothetical protein [Acutalibacteraceae bacterium]